MRLIKYGARGKFGHQPIYREAHAELEGAGFVQYQVCVCVCMCVRVCVCACVVCVC